MGPALTQALFGRILREYLRPADFGPTLTRVVATASNPDARTDALAPIFMSNALFEHGLLGMNLLGDRVKRWSAEEETNPERRRLLVERSLGLLGRAAARNVAACVRLNRMTETGLARKKTQVSVVDPHVQLRFALKAENFFIDSKLPFADQAFLAGLHYDWLAALLAARRASADARTAVEAVWNQGFRIGRLAAAIGGQLKNIKHGKMVFAAGALLPIGKLLMLAYFPKGDGTESWASFTAGLEKEYTRADDRKMIEELTAKANFQITYPELSALFAGFAGPFAPIEKVLRYHFEPWMLVKGDPHLHRLAQLLSLAFHLSVTVRSGAKLEKLPAIPRVSRRFLTEQGLSDEALLTALRGLGGR